MPMAPKLPEWAAPLPAGLRAQLAEALGAVTRDARNMPAVIRVAKDMLATDHAAVAIAAARHVAPLAAGSHAALLDLSLVFDAAGARADAIEAALAAHQLRPDDSAGELHLGSLLMAEGRHREAGEYLARHANLPGAKPEGWYMLSVALHMTGDLRRAVHAGERAFELNPGHPDYALHTAGIMGVLGRFGDAVSLLKRFLEEHPDHPRAWRSLSGMQEVTGDVDAAFASAERALALAPDDEALRTHRDHMAALAGPSAVSAGAVAEWATRQGPRRQAVVPRQPNPWQLVSAWGRKIVTLMLWEMQTRFAHSKLGYLWGIVEPMGHVATIGVVFALASSGQPPVGDNLFLYYVTGVCLYMAFQRGSEDTANAMAASRTALMLPNVRPLDVILARVGVTGITDAISLIVLVVGLGLVAGSQIWPRDPALCIAAFALTVALGCGTGMINMAIRSYIASWEYIWQFVSRFLYFLSGIYYSPLAMPNAIRDILVWNPVLQVIELFRAGFYPSYEPPWLDVPYIIAFVAMMLLVGLALQRVVLRRLLAGVAG